MSNIKSKRTISIYEHLYYRIPSETNKSKALSNLKVLHRPWTCTSVSFIDVRNLARKLLGFVPFMKNTKRKRNKKRSIQNDFEKKTKQKWKKGAKAHTVFLLTLVPESRPFVFNKKRPSARPQRAYNKYQYSAFINLNTCPRRLGPVVCPLTRRKSKFFPIGVRNRRR